jgi:hypothetical protein
MLDLSLKLMSGSFGLSLYSEAAILYLLGRSSGSIFLVGGESSTFFTSLGRKLSYFSTTELDRC